MKPEGMEAVRVGAAIMRAAHDVRYAGYGVEPQKQVAKKVRRSTSSIPENYNSSVKTGVRNA